LILHEVSWAMEGGDAAPRLGFGAWWYLYMARPLFAMLFLGWVWRLVLVYVLFWRIARLPLSLVPTHPDRTGGLDFIGYMPTAFVPLVFALGCVLGAHWAHDLVYHDVTVKALQWQMGIFVVVAVALSMSPLLVFAGPLRRARMRALLDMGAIAGSQGRPLQRRWTGGRSMERSSRCARSRFRNQRSPRWSSPLPCPCWRWPRSSFRFAIC
jgi:hypothetical protein